MTDDRVFNLKLAAARACGVLTALSDIHPAVRDLPIVGATIKSLNEAIDAVNHRKETIHG